MCPAASAGGEMLAAELITDASGTVICAVRGEVDMSNAAQLRGYLDAAFDLGPDVVVDLAELTFLASAGVGVLLEPQARGRRLAVVTGPATETVLRICGLSAVVPCLPSRALAVRELARSVVCRDDGASPSAG
ncbi:STAS domain-containing protein [Pseudonocardia hispaniensis]|uniref:STAS domain-containing protein n=1 Tax=Pseudonocardia hispaniensis TaxID=904933 RepID=A0ABW1J5W5_9PSEU